MTKTTKEKILYVLLLLDDEVLRAPFNVYETMCIFTGIDLSGVENLKVCSLVAAHVYVFVPS